MTDKERIQQEIDKNNRILHELKIEHGLIEDTDLFDSGGRVLSLSELEKEEKATDEIKTIITESIVSLLNFKSIEERKGITDLVKTNVFVDEKKLANTSTILIESDLFESTVEEVYEIVDSYRTIVDEYIKDVIEERSMDKTGEKDMFEESFSLLYKENIKRYKRKLSEDSEQRIFESSISLEVIPTYMNKLKDTLITEESFNSIINIISKHLGNLG